MDLEAIRKAADRLNSIDVSKLYTPEHINIQYDTPDLPVIDPENTIVGDIKRKMEEQNTLANQQIGILIEQNSLLNQNYMKLKEMYDAQADAYLIAQEDLKRSRRYNLVMMIISIIAMLAAIAGPIATILASNIIGR